MALKRDKFNKRFNRKPTPPTAKDVLSNIHKAIELKRPDRAFNHGGIKQIGRASCRERV